MGRVRVVWVSRPRRRAGTLVRALKDRGIATICRPAIRIETLEDGSGLRGYLERVEGFSCHVFVSAEAAWRVAERLGDGPTLKALAIGRATAGALHSRYRLPETPEAVMDTPTLLRSPHLPRAGRVAVLGGLAYDGTPPAPRLCDALREGGCEVTAVPCYRRVPVAAAPSLARLGAQGGVVASVCYSGDTLRAMLAMTAPDNGWLRRIPLFVIHPHIADGARVEGFRDVRVVEDGDLVRAVAEAVGNATAPD